MRRLTFAVLCLAVLVCACWAIVAGSAQSSPSEPSAPYFAMGCRVGEVTTSSAIVWTRLTAEPEARREAVFYYSPWHEPGPKKLPLYISERQLEGGCPGAPGRVRLIYGTRADLSGAKTTKWYSVGPEHDFVHQFKLSGLAPDTTYYYVAECTAPAGTARRRSALCSFRTAPPREKMAEVRFTVITGQMYPHQDTEGGFKIYRAMLALAPNFLVATGDTVYYDNRSPKANSVKLARYHWHRMYSLPLIVEFHRRVPGYWMKDDHDVYCNDCWPTIKPRLAPFTFAQGQRIFREQVPMGEKTYRTFRWGKGLQIWLPEGRDFRSPNTAPDGPDKTIWGKEQLAWLKRTILASDAYFRVLISATPIVGPDRKTKADNHANKAFAYEGNAFRRWVNENKLDNFFVVCGDRHWQYYSVDPETGVQEFSCGPVSDVHAGGSPGEDPRYHRFHRVKGGFLSVTVFEEGGRPTIAFRFHDVEGNVVYEHKVSR